MNFSTRGATSTCQWCGMPIEHDEIATAVMVNVWMAQARQYRAEGPFHAKCGKLRDLEAQASLETPNSFRI